jgi:hypothetical protein
MVMARIRITISLDTDSTSDGAVLEFLSGLPRRTRSEIIKEILFDALDQRNGNGDVTPSKPDSPNGTQLTDPDDIISQLF